MYHHLHLDKHLQFPQELFLAHGFQIFPSPTLDSSNMPLLHIKILYLEPNKSPKYHLTLWDSKTTSSHFLNTSRLALRGIFFHTLDFKWPTQNPRFFPRNHQTFQPPCPYSAPVPLVTPWRTWHVWVLRSLFLFTPIVSAYHVFMTLKHVF